MCHSQLFKVPNSFVLCFNWIISLVLEFLPTELMIVPVVAEVSVALPNGVVVQVAGAEGSGSIVAATVEHVAAVLPPLWPR